MAWEVEYTNEFESWFDELTADQQKAIDRCVIRLMEVGPHLGEPLVKRIVSSVLHNLKELRCSEDGALRVLFLFDPRRTAILLLGGDKTGQWKEWYETAIPEAEAVYAEYLEELKRAGLL